MAPKKLEKMPYSFHCGLTGLLFIVLPLVVNAQQQGQRTIKIGAVYEDGYTSHEAALQYAVEYVNHRRDILHHTTLEYDIQSVPTDSFHASKKVCKLMKDGVVALFGPMLATSAAHVQSICDSLDIPHVEARWDLQDNKGLFSVNVHPYYLSLSKAFHDIITYFKWKSFTILYEDNDGLVKLQELLKAPMNSKLSYTFTIKRLSAEDGDYRPILKEIKNRGESHIIIDCDVSKVNDILLQALQISMLSHYYHFMFTTLDLEMVNLDNFKYNGANITGFRLVNPDSPKVRMAMQDFVVSDLTTGNPGLRDMRTLSNASELVTVGFADTVTDDNPPDFVRLSMRCKDKTLKCNRVMKTTTALMYDAVVLVAQAIDDLTLAKPVEAQQLSCSKKGKWDTGLSLLTYIKMATLEGLTGLVKIDANGRRTEFDLDIVKLGLNGLQKVGVWNMDAGVNITVNETRTREEIHDSLQNKTFIVTTILEPPYAMMKEAGPGEELRGNDQFYGYCIDLIDEIAKMLDFNYTIKLVSDGNYGAPVGPKGEWNGMVRELMDKKADIAIAPLTISYVREQVIDFTKPFMNLGISILFKKPKASNPDLFSFLSPLSFDIWIYMIGAYMAVSFMLFVLARFSPYEWQNPHPCNQESDVVENQFTLLNSLWFTIGSLMQQGSDIAPRAVSTRLVSAIWWFFTLIMISSYTANLAAFLTVERMTSPIENADDLAKQTEIKYGSQYGGSTMTFFKTSKIPTYERMWNFMESTEPSVFVNSSKLGIERVKRGKYAYLMESTMIEYTIQRNCDLMSVGGLLDSKGYGIATPRNSPYTELLSDAVLKLSEQQRLQMLYTKWWKEKEGGGQCEAEVKKDASALSVVHVGGVFVVLLGGLALSIFVALLEFIYKARKNADEDRQSLCSEMAEELRFAVRCIGSSKKPTKEAKKRAEEGRADNGLTLVPLTGGDNMPVKDPYGREYNPYHVHDQFRRDQFGREAYA